MKKTNFNKIALLLTFAIIIIVIANLFIISGIKKELIAKTSVVSVKLQYTMELENETIIKSGILDSVVGKISSDLGLDSVIVDDKVANMTAGEEWSLKIAREDAFGEYEQSKVFIVNRTEKTLRKSDINRTFIVPLSNAQQVFNEAPILNKTYSVSGDPMQYKVLGINGSNVKISREVQLGKIIPLSEIIFMNITEVGTDKIKTELGADAQTMEVPAGNLTVSLDKDYILFKLTPAMNQEITFSGAEGRVVSMNETTITLDGNREFAGEDIVIEIKILEKSQE